MRFYFTLHPSDLSRQRLVPGAHAMLVASSLWDTRQSRLRLRRPPSDVLTSIVLDSGGYTAAKKWGQYPWTVDAYAAWARQYAEGPLPLDWVAVMDYACEQGVDRSAYTTNRERIAATVTNAQACIATAPYLPWLPVVQGYTLEEYRTCLAAYDQAGISLKHAGLGTICGRPVRQAIQMLRALRAESPQTRWHVFGMHLGVLDDAEATAVIQSWDSYAWDWEPNGCTGRSAWKRRRFGLPQWTYSKEVRARGEAYLKRVHQAITQPRTLPLFSPRDP